MCVCARVLALVCATVSSCVTAASAAIISLRTCSLGCRNLCMSALISQSVTQTAAAHLPASLSRLPSEGLTPYCQWRRLSSDPPPPPLQSICHHLWSVCTSPRVYLLLPTFLPSFTQSPVVTADSGLSNVPAAAGSSIIKRLRRIEIISIRALR